MVFGGGQRRGQGLVGGGRGETSSWAGIYFTRLECVKWARVVHASGQL